MHPWCRAGNFATSAIVLLVATQNVGATEQECDSTGVASSAPTGRFRSEPDGTVTDTKSRLMWMRCAAGQTWVEVGCAGPAQRLSWEGAQHEVAVVNQSGKQFYNDWRMPRLPELASITELVCKNPRINSRVFPSTPPDFFWSATSRATASPTPFAFVLSFGPDGVKHESKEEKHFVRWVRNAS